MALCPMKILVHARGGWSMGLERLLVLSGGHPVERLPGRADEASRVPRAGVRVLQLASAGRSRVPLLDPTRRGACVAKQVVCRHWPPPTSVAAPVCSRRALSSAPICSSSASALPSADEGIANLLEPLQLGRPLSLGDGRKVVHLRSMGGERWGVGAAEQRSSS